MQPSSEKSRPGAIENDSTSNVAKKTTVAAIEAARACLLALLALFGTGWCTARSARRAATDAQTREPSTGRC
jgi:hypothetical protein